MERRRLLRAVCVCAVALTFAPVVDAQSSRFELELGYQWLDVTGNEEMYRSQINEDDGFVLRSLSFSDIQAAGGNGVYDRLVIDASGFGGSPNGFLRVEAGRADLYRMRLIFNRFEQFSALPGLANPFLEQGVVPGQHTMDRDREMLDLEVELLPGRRLSPLVGYRWNRSDGPRRTTYHVGEDEFQLGSDLKETEKEFRAGLLFHFGDFRGSVVQGWRDFKGRETTWLMPGYEGGNGPGTVLGEDVVLDEYNATQVVKADAPVTTAHLTGTLGDRTRLTFSFVHADNDSEVTDDQMLSGSLVSFRISRFFEGLQESVSSRTESPSWRGDLRAEVDLTETLSLEAGYGQRSRTLDGWALVSSLYLETVNFSGFDSRDVLELIEAETSYEREQSMLDVKLTAREVGPFRLWAGWSMNNEDLDVIADPTQISVPGAQEGEFDRQVDTYQVGGAVALGDFDVMLDWQSEDADEAVVRTDFLDRERLRLRLGWHWQNLVRVLGTFEQIDADNMTEGIGYDGEIERMAVDLEITPMEQLTLGVAYDTYDADSMVVIRTPETFGLDVSMHSEEAEILEADLRWKFDRFTVAAGLSQLDNDGSFPYELDRTFIRLGFDITEAFGATAEFETAEYSEDQVLAFGDFEADRIGVFLRWRP